MSFTPNEMAAIDAAAHARVRHDEALTREYHAMYAQGQADAAAAIWAAVSCGVFPDWYDMYEEPGKPMFRGVA